VPLGDFAPVQPPAAIQEDALVEDQFMVDTFPDAMLVGLAENATVGAGLGEGVGEGFPEAGVPKSKSILATTGG
jgi:hypothetical protein